MDKLQMEKLAALFSDSEKFLGFDINEDNYNAYFLYALKYNGGLADKLEDREWAALLATKENPNSIDTAKLADMLANFPNLADCYSLRSYINRKQLSTTEDLSAEQANLMFNMGFAETTRSALKEIITSHRQSVLAKVQSCVDNNDAMASIVESISNATDKESIDQEVLKSIFADIKAQMDEGTLEADSTKTVHVNRAGKKEQAKDGSSRIAGKIAKYSYLLTADGQIIITPKRKTSQFLKDQQDIEQLTNDIQEQEVALSVLSTELELKQEHANLRRDELEAKKSNLPSLKAQLQKEESNIKQYKEKAKTAMSLLQDSVQLDESDLNERGRRILIGINRQAITNLRKANESFRTKILEKSEQEKVREAKVQLYEEVIAEQSNTLSSAFEKKAERVWGNLENTSFKGMMAQFKDSTTNQTRKNDELKPALKEFNMALKKCVEMATSVVTDKGSLRYGEYSLVGDSGSALNEQYDEVIDKIKTAKNREDLVDILKRSTAALNDIGSARELSRLQDRKNSLEELQTEMSENRREIESNEEKIQEEEEQNKLLGQIDSFEKSIKESTVLKNKLQARIDQMKKDIPRTEKELADEEEVISTLSDKKKQMQASISQLESPIEAARESKEKVKESRKNVAKFAGSIKQADRVVTLILPSATEDFQVEGQVLMHRKVKADDPNAEVDKQSFIADVKSDDHRARQVASGYFLTQNKGLALVDAMDNRKNSQVKEPKKPIEELVQRTFAQVIAAQKRQQIMGDIKVENIFSGNPCVIFDQRDRNEQKVVLNEDFVECDFLVFTRDGDDYGSVPLTITRETNLAFQGACKSAQDKGLDISYLDTFGMLGALVMAEEVYDLDQDVFQEVEKILQTMRDVFSNQKESFNLDRTAANKNKLPLLHEVLCRKMENGDTIGDALGGPAVFDITLPNGKEKFADLGKDEIEQLPQIFTEQLIRAEYKEGFTPGSMPEIAAAPAPTGILSALQATAQTHSSPSPSIASSREELIQAVATKLRLGSAQQKYRTTPGAILSKAKKMAHRKTYYSTQAKKLVNEITRTTNSADLASMKENIDSLQFNIEKTGKQHYTQVRAALAKSPTSAENPSSNHNPSSKQ